MEPLLSSHPVPGLVARARARVGELVEQPLYTLDAAGTREALSGIAALTSQLAELEARLLGHAGVVDAYATSGAVSAATGLAHTTRTTRSEAHGKVRLARLLEAHPLTREALARGEVRPDQARVIATAVDDLPDPDDLDRPCTDPDLRDQAEKHLLAAAEHHDATELRVLGRRLLEVADPAKADAHEAARLEREEREALRQARFTITDCGDGTSRGRFTLPTAQASMWLKALRALAAPKHRRAVEGAGAYDHTTSHPDRMGQALCEWIERYPTDRLPATGGLAATVVVTMTLETLLGGDRAGQVAAHLDTGVALSPTQARRWACEAGIMPAVLDGRGHLLDLGHTQRLHSSAQRIAHLVELTELSPTHTPTCEQPTCDVPAAWCHAHHGSLPWSRGGTTTLRDLAFLCPRHHALAHTPRHDTPMRT